MPGKMSFCAALVAASLAALAAIQVTSANFASRFNAAAQPAGLYDYQAHPDTLEKDFCAEEFSNYLSIVRSPVDVNDPDRSVEIHVTYLPRKEMQACGFGLAEEICKSTGFKAARQIFQTDLYTEAECLKEIPTTTPGAGRFGALAADCNEELIKVLREPSATDDDLSIRVEVDEISEVGRQACGRAAAKEACKTNLRGFATALRLDQNGSFVDGVCSN